MKRTRSWRRAAPTSPSSTLANNGAEWCGPLRLDPSGPHVVELAGVHVQAVHDLPQRRQRLQPVAPFERGQVLAMHLQDAGELPVDVDQLPLRLAQLLAH